MGEDLSMEAKEILSLAERIVRAGPICDECLGRTFGRLGYGLTNRARGKALRTVLSMLGTEGKAGTCWVCGGLFETVDDWAKRAASAAAGYEFSTYLFGVKLTPRLVEMERFFQDRFPSDSYESLRHSFNRAVGKEFERIVGRGAVDFHHPDISFTVDLARDALRMHVASLYIYGRYRKLVRGIPQTHWPCRKCGGKGCPECNYTGKQYPESVEELIAGPFIAAAGASGAHLHGAGREDIDARMLGTGRPFVLELLSPKLRRLDIPALTATVNRTAEGKVEISGTRITDKATVALLKETRGEKTYRALVAFGAEVTEEALNRALSTLIGPISQRTPTRVAHRRADLVRTRRLISATGHLLSPTRAEITLRSEGGLYIKELISGDEGRTHPNLSEKIGVSARVIELDVLSVKSTNFPDEASALEG